MRHTFTLANGVEIPAVGFGTYKAADNTDEAIISEAIRQGYRHLDTAAFYFNEEAVGKAVRESGIPREEFFLTSKVWKDQLGYDSTLQEFENSCKRLGTDYLDLYLIHWPRPSDLNAEWRDLDVETWKALEDLYKSKKVRAIGVSNFLPHHLNNLLERTSITPMVNQLEFHPGYMQKAAVDFCKQMGIQIEAWSRSVEPEFSRSHFLWNLQKNIRYLSHRSVSDLLCSAVCFRCQNLLPVNECIRIWMFSDLK